MTKDEKKKIVKMVDIVPIEKSKTTHNKKKESEEKKLASLNENKKRDNDFENFFEEMTSLKKDTDEKRHRTKNKRKLSRNKKFLILFLSLFIVASGVYASVKILPKASIIIVEHKKPWNFNGSVVVDANINSVDVNNMYIPGEIFKQNKNITLKFKATSKKYIKRKSTGTITIYNDFSSAPQVLVKTTRFETKDGKVYRIVKKVVVPGAKIVNGKIQPSSVDAIVVADKSGSEYNIGPVEKFTIPGFYKTKRFYGFYGKSFKAMTGGIIGEVPYPSDKDISNAKESVKKTLEDALTVSLSSQIPNGFVFLSNAKDITINKISVNTVVDNDGKFSVFGEGTALAMIFKEDDMLRALKLKGIEEDNLKSDFSTKEKKISYSNPLINWSKKTMTIPIKYSAVLWHPVDANKIKSSVIGKNSIELKTYILSMPYIDGLTIKFWPFWVNKVPEKQSKIIVDIQ